MHMFKITYTTHTHKKTDEEVSLGYCEDGTLVHLKSKLNVKGCENGGPWDEE